MVNWRTLEARVDGVIGVTFGEQVRHHPMKNGVADTGRTITLLNGVLHTPSPEGTINIAAGLVSTMVSAEAALVVERSKFPVIVFHKGDRIKGMDLPGQPFWEVKSVNDRYSSILVLALNQV
ncbi:hypothetical protein F4V91_08610 [Neorhizobium galegae]|uniref:Uncharacterized protein n=1 Tax=Neorhizobium galegae TaxID=399 RepID=A0A6A1TSD9_NEOGA|nr:hypothetical protein [Neorhizobium galegae]KAB1086484.1 hypothetical protein F4V91_08610 [Neorhizobium galegae]